MTSINWLIRRLSGFCTTKPPGPLSIPYSLEGRCCVQPTVKEQGALFPFFRVGYLHDLFVILLHRIFISSPPFINFIQLFTYISMDLWKFCYILSYSLILFYFVAQIVQLQPLESLSLASVSLWHRAIIVGIFLALFNFLAYKVPWTHLVHSWF